MLELIQESITSYNLPFTVLLGLVLLYWLTAAIGMVDLDSFDVDVDLDADVEGDAGAEAGSISALGGFLKFVNADRVPVMIVASLLAIFLWMGSLALNSSFNADGSLGKAMLFLIPNLIGSLILTKIVTQPLKALFSKISLDGETHEPVVGRTGTVKSSEITDSFGQVEIPTDGAPLLVNARLADGIEEPIAKNASVVVLRHDKELNLYFVRHL